jgi:hypothetical protein
MIERNSPWVVDPMMEQPCDSSVSRKTKQQPVEVPLEEASVAQAPERGMREGEKGRNTRMVERLREKSAVGGGRGGKMDEDGPCKGNQERGRMGASAQSRAVNRWASGRSGESRERRMERNIGLRGCWHKEGERETGKKGGRVVATWVSGGNKPGGGGKEEMTM